MSLSRVVIVGGGSSLGRAAALALMACALAGGVEVIHADSPGAKSTSTAAERAYSRRDLADCLVEASPACESWYYCAVDPAVLIPPPRTILDGMSKSWSLLRSFEMTGITYRKGKDLVRT